MSAAASITGGENQRHLHPLIDPFSQNHHSHLPYHLIRNLTKFPGLWYAIDGLEWKDRILSGPNLSQDDQVSSCMNTVSVISNLFFSSEERDKISSVFRMYVFSLKVTHDKSGLSHDFIINNEFLGIAIYKYPEIVANGLLSESGVCCITPIEQVA